MKPFSSLRRCWVVVFFLVAVWPVASFSAPAPESASLHTDYAARLAAARQFASEGSWSLARDAFREALPLAPTDSDKRWTELWLDDATRRALGAQERKAAWEAHRAQHERLAEPYEHGAPPDAFWTALMENHAAWLAYAREGDAWALRKTVADALAQRAPTRQNAEAYVDFLQRCLSGEAEPPVGSNSAWRDHLAAAARAATDPERRAWCLVELADRTADAPYLSVGDKLAAFDAAVTAAQGTSWAPRASAAAFLWRAERGLDQDGPEGARPDFPKRIQTVDALRAALASAGPGRSGRDLRTRLSQLGERWRKPVLSVLAPRQLRADEPLAFGVGSSGLGRLRMSLYALPPAVFASRSTAGEPPSPKPPGKPVWTLEKMYPHPEFLRWETDVISIPERLKSGLYTLVVEGVDVPEAFSVSDLVLSDVQVGSSVAPDGELQLVFQNVATGRPLAGASVAGTVSGGGGAQPFTGRTDSEGVVRVKSRITSHGSVAVTGIAGTQAFACQFYAWRLVGEDQFTVDLVLDRPLYRPGETVHWKTIVREDQAERLRIPDAKDGFSWWLELGGEKLAPAAPLVLNRFGTANGEIVLNPTLKPGAAEFVLRREKPGAPAWERRITAFNVDHFQPPALQLKLDLASAPDSLQPGREVRLRARLQYLSGGPAAGVDVTCQLNPIVVRPFDADRSTESPNWKALSQPLQEKTDAAGEAVFSFTIPAPAPEGLHFNVLASAVPAGGQPVEASRDLNVTRGGLLVDAPEDPLRAVAPGSDVTFHARILNGLREPAPFHGVAELVEERWVGLWLDSSGTLLHRPPGPEVKDPVVLHDGWATLRVAQQPVEVGGDGQLSASFRLPRAGIFRLRVLAPDGETPLEQSVFHPFRGRGLDGRLAVIACSANPESLALPPETALVVAPSPSERGRSSRLLCVLPAGAGSAFLSVWDGHRQGIQRLDAPARVAWADVPRDLAPAGPRTASLAWFGNAPGYSRSATWFEDDPARHLRVEIEPSAKESKPGEAVNVRFQVADGKGRPRASELSFSVSDEAVNRLVGRQTQEPRFASDARQLDAGPNLQVSPLPAPFPAASPPDVRPGAVLHAPALAGEEIDEVILLSPFEVAGQGERGYYAASVAGSGRMRMKLADRDTVLGQGRDAAKAADPVLVRRHFSSTAFWAPEVVAGKDGLARLSFNYPDNLTEWRLEAYAVGGDGESFGTASAFTRTSLPFQSRLQLPRFLVAGDRAEVSALLVNRTDQPLVSDLTLKASGPVADLPVARVAADLAPHGEARHGWVVQANGPGDAEFTLEGRSQAGDDGMHLGIPVIEDGIVQHVSVTGQLRADEAERTFTLPLPDPLDPARAQATVQLTSSRAAVVLDALPYLIDYPYGCVEQTMSRFFPATAVQHALRRLGLSPDDLGERLRRETEDRREGPVQGWRKLDEVIAYGLQRISDAQRHDGGFGWWPGDPQGDLWMTSYVVWGLTVVRESGVDVPAELLGNARAALIHALQEAGGHTDTEAFALAALARDYVELPEEKAVRATFENLFANRASLGASGRACLALATVAWGTDDQRRIARENLRNGAVRAKSDDAGDTAHWGSTDSYWRSSDNAVECTALTLLALLRLEPDGALIEPASNWLVLNRRSARWTSTRDTAFAVLALTELLTAKGELVAEAEADVELEGYSVGRVRLNRAALLQGAQEVTLSGNQLHAGANRINLRRTGGKGPIYVTVLSSSWARGDTVKPFGHQATVARGLVRQAAQPTLSGRLMLSPVELGAAGVAKAGEQIDAELHLELPNDLEYLVVEVPRPAGCEPLNPLSGWDATLAPERPAGEKGGPDNAGLPVYREEHDTRSAFFIRSLHAGRWVLRFGLRAVTPGDYRVLPAEFSAMYVPEIRANSDARRLKIEKP